MNMGEPRMPGLLETGPGAGNGDRREPLPLLIAEDDLTTRTMLAAVTGKWGYAPVTVEDGNEAWRIMQGENAPRLLLLDWMMPGLDGLALCRRIRQRQTNDPPYIVLLTSRHETGDVVTAIEAGANDHIAKPYDNAELEVRLQAGRRILEMQSELIRNAEQLRLSASVFTHALEGIMITDPDGTIVDVNEAFSRITGFSREEAIGNNPRLLKSGHQDRDFYENMWRSLTTHGQWRGELWNRRKDGEVYAEIINISAVPDSRGDIRHYIALFSDITAQKEQLLRLEQIAHNDPLTGLPNRTLLTDRLHQAMAQSQRHERHLAVVYLDLDGFKDVNDRHGHAAGDRLLTRLADNMRHILREIDTIARLGGDEFVALLPDLDDPGDCLPVLERLLATVSRPVPFNGSRLQVSASLGVTFYPQDDDVDADRLLRQADQAMYQAKLAGKNRYHIFDHGQSGGTVSGA